jgi:type IV pilus assembly protein PilB
VLSTLHTNGAVATLARLVDMGAEPSLLASTLRLVVAQRLVRRICGHCHSDTVGEETKAAAVRLGLPSQVRITSSSGCEHCHYTGYRGRLAIYELLSVSEAIKDAIASRLSEVQLLRIAAKEGFTSMLESAQVLIDNGTTTPTEVLRELIN